MTMTMTNLTWTEGRKFMIDGVILMTTAMVMGNEIATMIDVKMFMTVMMMTMIIKMMIGDYHQ